jgi:hypothetical protein
VSAAPGNGGGEATNGSLYGGGGGHGAIGWQGLIVVTNNASV